MEQKRVSLKWVCGSVVVFIGLLLLAGTVPNTGGIIEGAPRHGMWRCGPFLFYPDAFFGVVGVVAVATACTLFGIVRGNAFEIVGWILLGILLFRIVMR